MEKTQELTDLLQKFKNDLDQFKKAKIKCGIIGRSGTGKSSLINAIVGEHIAEVGEIETTMAMGKPIEHRGLLFYDLPGCSTTNFPKEEYINHFDIGSFDCVILVTSDRFYEDDLFLIDELSKIKMPVFAVRTKLDFSIDRGLRRGVPELNTCNTIMANLEDNLKGYRLKGIYLTSADYPQEYELGKLLNDIYSSLGKFKQERFIADINITSEKILIEKRTVAKKMVFRYSALSAANGINPIPGLDVGVDIGLLIKMGKDIEDIYGLGKEQQIFNSELLEKNQVKLLAAKALQFSTKYLGKEAILILLKTSGTRVATKSASKWIPFVGPAIAASLGFYFTSSIGEDMVKDAEEIATETFNAFKTIKMPTES